MKIVDVYTQEDLDKFLADESVTRESHVINVRGDGVFRIDDHRGLYITLWDDVRAELLGNSYARLRGDSKAELRDNARAELHGSTQAELRGNAQATLSKYAVAFRHSDRSVVTGPGTVIDTAKVDLFAPENWAEYTGIHVDDEGKAHLYKAVDDNYCAGHGYRLTKYVPGQSVTSSDWVKNNRCGNGLHACPTVTQARSHFPEATRFLEVVTELSALCPIDEDKCKAETVTVLREVDKWGKSLEEGGGKHDHAKSPAPFLFVAINYDPDIFCESELHSAFQSSPYPQPSTCTTSDTKK